MFIPDAFGAAALVDKAPELERQFVQLDSGLIVPGGGENVGFDATALREQIILAQLARDKNGGLSQ